VEQIRIKKTQGWSNILKIILPFVFIVVPLQILGAYFVGIKITEKRPAIESTYQHLVLMLMYLTGTFLTIWIFFKLVDEVKFSSLGFSKKHIKKDILVGLFLGFLPMLFGFFILVGFNQIEITAIQFNFKEFILCVGLYVCIAVSEELLNRGYIITNLLASFNKYISILISSLIFSFMHGANPNFSALSFVSLVLAGIIFGTGYVYSQNLWFPIALHFSWNFFQGTIFGFNVSGQKIYSLITTKFDSENIWNGGKFGFEGSVLSIIFQLIMLAAVYYIFKSRYKEIQS